MKNLSCVMLVVMVIVGCVTPLSASSLGTLQGPVAPMFTHISSIITRLSISAWGVADCLGSVTLYSSSNTAILTMELQRREGLGWTMVRVWVSSGPGLPGVYMDNHHWVVRGTYRLRCTARAYSASGTLLEVTTVLSREVTY
ncbi:MAG: hypothetical protein KGZ64_08215 [Thermaerobacter sp.]|nr:hypothetical protein [Thermaerobacter sp.]